MESNARARTLGAELRDLRKAKRVSLIGLGAQVGLDKNTISRTERGERVASETEVASILGALGVVGGKRRELLQLAREAAKSSWLETAAGLPSQHKALMEYEKVATSIMDVTALLVPGLLQTPAYARAVMTEGDVATSEIETLVELRLTRQDVLTRDKPVPYMAIIDEFVLRRPVGGRSVMAGQARHLLDMAQRPNVTIRVVPQERGYHMGLFGSFIMLESARTTPVVHLEHLRSGVFLYKMQDIQPYLDIKPALMAAAVGPEGSLGLITKCAEEMEGRQK
ncbi:helix-turn-helix domain-containing protein [Actinosynnema sp. CS-041913]|uniref:helix-turn-helix domain-containing protein n=1 Tax=Actinosynnema sp. CS-041913 TaxID=3239917 RepID=UPI003D91BBCC